MFKVVEIAPDESGASATGLLAARVSVQIAFNARLGAGPIAIGPGLRPDLGRGAFSGRPGPGFGMPPYVEAYKPHVAGLRRSASSR